jgi:hypothetical protein
MRLTTWYPAAKGDKRVTTWFALWPVKLGNDFRWLERVTVEWEYVEEHHFFPPCAPYLKWQPIRFVDTQLMEEGR